LVTRPGAVAILANSFVATIRSLVFVCPVVSGMTAGAVGLKGRILPGN